ncbi:hypothetical protein [Streptomyces sp. MK37H]|uniref:hypothetical protein n=1 Tax=Streptomyces sp. MK37H TaxID=2699117 RepID=UPI001B399245|nr:hypothetical protein [Streptomyces sp. MK37H]MBP8533202.1 hypothetical protein [Streptomyces sp. MK37H]
MRTRPASVSLDIPHDDARLRYRGAVSLQRATAEDLSLGMPCLLSASSWLSSSWPRVEQRA